VIPSPFMVPPGRGPRLFISAGDHSGDLHGALLIRALKKAHPFLRIEGVGGPAMIEEGLHCHHNMLDLGVMFFLEVLLRLPTLGKIYDQLYRYFESDPPDLLVFIDYPGFNLFLAKKAKVCGIPTYYYCVPQLWAWAPWRIHRVKQRIDRMAVLFEFEKEWYQKRGLTEVVTVGHPLYEHLAQKSLNPKVLESLQEYAKGAWIIGLLPGSRTREIHRNFPALLEAAQELKKKIPQLVFVVPCAKKKLYTLLKKYLEEAQFPALLLPGYAHEVMSVARFCYATSGTVTIELLFYKVPALVVYRIGTFAYALLQASRFLGLSFLRCSWITLVNLLAQKEVFPERLHSRLSASWLVQKSIPLIQEGEVRNRCFEEMEELHRLHIRSGASSQTAQDILNVLKKILTKKI
jgi:lipid-A-disaccharide synthase